MRHRRFLLLAAALVAVNVFFWLAQGGFALPRAVIGQLFGARMIRAEVLVQGAGGQTVDYLIDRGDVTAATATSITLREANGDVRTFAVSASVRIRGRGRVASADQLRSGMRVLVLRQANGPVELVQVEAVGRRSNRGNR